MSPDADGASRAVRRLGRKAMKFWRRLGGAIVLTACLVPAIPLSSAAAGVPLLTVESPIAGSSTRAVEPTIAGKSNDPTDEVTVDIFAGEAPLGEPPLGVPVAPLGSVKVSATGDWSAAPHTPLAQGLYTARATQ